MTRLKEKYLATDDQLVTLAVMFQRPARMQLAQT
jgi:hypothetical protein